MIDVHICSGPAIRGRGIGDKLAMVPLHWMLISN